MKKPAETRRRLTLIWDVVCDIPRGSVANYGQIGEIAGIVRGARQVGFALRSLPANTNVPWHRVVRSSGGIAFPEGSDAFIEQKKRLMMEGVPVNRGKVDMRRFKWQPDLDELLWKPSASWDRNDE